jgi:hypothetical protein
MFFMTSSFISLLNFYSGSLCRKQLIAAIGKVVTPRDVTDYMKYHYKKVYKPEYQPHNFSYAVTLPKHDPEGMGR